MAAQHAEVAHVFRLRLAQHQRSGWRGGLEPDGKKHHFAARVLLGQLQCVGGGVDHANVGPARFGFDQRQVVGCRNPHGVAIGTQHHTPVQRQANGQVDAANRQHTHRATRAVDHAHIGRQHAADAVARNGVRVAAAELHEVVGHIRPSLSGNGVGNTPGGGTVAEFINVFHSGSRCVYMGWVVV